MSGFSAWILLPVLFLAGAVPAAWAVRRALRRAPPWPQLRARLAQPRVALALLAAQVASYGLLTAMGYGAARWFDGNESKALVVVFLVVLSAHRLLASILKVALCISLFAILRDLYAHLADRRLGVLRSALVFAATAVVALVPLVLLRDTLGPYLWGYDTEVVDHTYDHAVVDRFYPGLREGHEAWVEAWDSGAIAATELAFLGLLIAGHVLLGRAFGRRRRAPWVGVAFTLVLALGFAWGFDLVTSGRDLQHNGILAGPLVFELAVPFVYWYPESFMVAPFAAVFLLGAGWLLRRFRGAPDAAPACRGLRPAAADRGA